jgi:ABC-type transport system involved in cytochrome bd biosynthesis fused ATPase/permease subunit
VHPIDRRLLRHARAARGYLIAAVGFGLAAAALILAQAGLLARALATAARPTAAPLWGTLLALLAVVAARAAVAYGGEAAALRAAATVKSQLRRALAARALGLGPAWVGGQQTGKITTLATRGLDGLDPYFARYVPQLILAVAVPIAVLARVAAADWISAIVIAVTLPLIPMFAVLVGWHTKARTRRQWRLLATLAGHFLDVVEGLPTLKIFGRARAQEEVIGKVTREYRATTMSALRVAFLSALVLELAASVATALVAVEVGLRLLYGHMAYETALLVLLLTPEAFLPLRSVSAQFHASMEGAAAAGQVLDILDTKPDSGVADKERAGGEQRAGEQPVSGVPADGAPAGGVRASGVPAGGVRADAAPAGGVRASGAPADARPANGALATSGRPGRVAGPVDLRAQEITLSEVTVAYPGRRRAALDVVSLVIRPGERILVTGPSGAGKSTLLALLLRFAVPAAGTIRAGGADLAAIGDDRWRAQIAWVPQQPHLFAGSVADNIALGQRAASPEAIQRAARLAGAAEFIEALPDGYQTTLGERALRLSAGQRQKIALARAFLRDAPLLLLDEPAAHLDPASTRQIVAAVETALADRTVVLVSHGPGLAPVAGRVIRLDHGKLADQPVPPSPARPAAAVIP